MKKLLSILICVLLGVSSATFAQGTVTVNAYALGEGISQATNATTYGGGTVQVWTSKCTLYPKVGNITWGSWGTNGAGQTSTHSSKEYKALSSYTGNNIGIRYKMQAIASTGYYFAGWTQTNSLSATIVSAVADFPETSTAYKNQTYSLNYYAIFKKQTVHRDYAKVVAIYVDSDGTPVYTGDLANPSSIQFTQGGGYVNMGAVATNQTEVVHGDYNTIIYRDADTHTWDFTYYATPAANYAFVGWYSETTLLAQLQANGFKLDMTRPDDGGNSINGNEYNKSYTSECKDAAQAPVAPTMYAVFRPSMTYYYSGPTAYVAMNEPDGGLVYVDKGEAGSIAGVPAAKWNTEFVDNTQYEQEDNNTYSFVYYAKPNDKYAFKGWATTQYGAPVYGNEYPNDPYTYPYVMSDENTSPENPFITRALYAVFESFYYRKPAAMLASNSQDAGYVYVSLTNEDMPANWEHDEQPVGDLQQVPAHGTEYAYQVYYRARPKNNGNEFYGWSSTSDGLNIVSYNDTYVETYTTQLTNRNYPHVASPLYAVFRSDIDIRQQDRMIVYTDAEENRSINDAKVLVDFQKGNTLTAALSGADASCFILSNRTGSKSGSSITFDATQGLIELVLSYKGDLATAVGKIANITFSNQELDISRTIAIVVEEAPIISFLPTDGKGAYTISMTNGSGVNYVINADDKQNVDVAITHESMSNIEVNLTSDAADDFYFFGWEMIDGDNRTYISHEKLCTYQFTKSVKVRPEFIPNNRATYFLLAEKDDPNKTIYHDLQKALDDAELNLALGGEQVVVLNDKDGMGTEVVLPKGTYTIPRGVVLLIPGDNAYTNRAVLDETDYESAKNPSTTELHNSRYYTKLNVEDGTKIIVEGGLNVYARLQINNQTWLGRPWRYGWIDLGENCTIDVENSASINIYGYITGPLTTAITIKNGATVRESFQIRDWHGGTETINYITGQRDHRVFPSSQFYIQNVEVPMTLEYGAKEELMAAVNIGSVSVVKAPFVDLQDGLFHINTGTKLTKYYDKYTDSQVYIMEGSGAGTQVELGKIELKDVAVDMPIIGTIKQDVSSSDYVLPLPHNMDITIKNTNLLVSYDFAFLAGSKLTIDKTATVTVNGNSSQAANMFIYDRAQNGAYFGTSNAQMIPVGYRPTTTYDTKKDNGILYQRHSDDLQDASFVVDGLLTCGNYGYLYTTNTANEVNHCANITSNGGGKIYVANLGTKSVTYQRQMGAWINIPVTPARMRNGDGTYKSPNDEGGKTTYTYTQNKWQAGDLSGAHKDPVVANYLPTFTINVNPINDTYVGDVTSTQMNITPQNNAVDWGTVEWSQVITGVDADQFGFDNSNPNIILFTPKSEGKKHATLKVTATYTRNVNANNAAVKYVYSKNISLEALAKYLHANTLAFESLNTVYEGQPNIPLLKNKNSDGQITVKVENNNAEIRINNSTSNQEFTLDYATQNTFDALKKGEVTITVTQAADLVKKIAATTLTKTIEVKDPVQWNWDILYLGERYDTPITMLDGSTDWTLTETTDTYNIIDFKGSAPNYTASVANLIAGSFKIDFTFTQNGKSRPFTSHVIVDPRHLRVDVNNDTVFRAVTLSANENVDFRGKQVTFTSTVQSISQWNLGFYGVPDKMCFIPNGTNTWQIEESPNGVNWTTSFPWKKLPTNESFEWSLIPSTRYVRISYGAGNVNPTTKVNNATLNEFYITELTDVKADQNKLYMPVEEILPATDPKTYKSVTKEVVLTYANVSKIGVNVRALDSRYDGFFSIKKPDGTLTDSYNWTSLPEFGVMGLEVVCHPTVEKEVEGVIDVFADSKQVLQIPIQTYLFPQELPIKLATDKPDGGDRYYFVTTHTHNAEWDGTDGVRTITLQNAVSDAAPYLTFAFKGAPTYISFNYTANAKGTWKIEESVDGKSWSTVLPKEGDVMADGYLKRTVTATSQYLKVIYESPYAEKVDINNLVIVGDASVVVPARLELDYDVPEALIVSAINLPSMTLTTDNLNFQVTHRTDNGTYTDPSNPSLTLTSSDYSDALGENKMGNVTIFVKWTGDNAIEYATLTITNPADSKVLGVVELVGMKSSITDGEINISTGVAPGYTLNGSFDENGKKHRPVDVKAAFSEAGTAHFDYVVVYGETTTDDGSTTITTPNTMVGSNAKTPCYIYKKKGDAYELKKVIENTNSKDKAWHLTDMLDINGEEPVANPNDMDAVQIPNGKESVSMYITGFCPYASTGYTKADEGVWYFRAKGGQSIDIYLEDCYIYSRSKTADGHAFIDRQDGYSFSERFVCGTGAVFVFACNEVANTTSMNVTIHTLDSNLVKSHYGCFLQSIAGRAYQASSPVQIRVLDDTYVTASKTTLNFTDEWPVSKNPITATRTNGFVSLQKQVNNAPSIDMGNKNTIVNFNGGQVELQNAQIVSTNYKSSLAICPRSGEFAGVLLAYGMGTDDVRGTVYFNDGTTTVLPMYVSPNFAESYLLDKDANGSYITNSKGEFRTSCLRTPTNTFVTGGSHCMMRACKDPSSQGGAPKDKEGNDGKLLGLYKFPKNPEPGKKGGWTEVENGLVDVVTSDEDPVNHQVPVGYNVNSITPNNNGTKDKKDDDFLNFWFDPDFEPSAKPEVDRTKSFWKTCMTRIEADYGGYGGAVGGPTEIAMAGDVQDEIVKYLLYCKIDENILSVLEDETYQAPVKNPAPSGDNYVPVHPSKVEGTEYFISNKDTFRVNEKIYYITTATADVWNAFTAPFDVKNIYIMEAYPENELEEMEWKGKKNRSDILMEQAKHNADFAAFFAVTIALGQEKTFETIYREYMTWADLQDKTLGLDTKKDYTPRRMKPLTPYNGSNWQDADFYLNENAGEWILHSDPDSLEYFKTQWIIPNLSDGTLMEQGKTYSMLLPFCTGCVDYEIQTDANGNPVKDAEGKPVFKFDAWGNKIPLPRDYWDYWSGKFLIFESTYAGPVELPTGEVVDGPGHTIYGSDYVEALAASPEYIESGAVLTGNCSFADLQTMNEELFTYSPDIKHSTFYPIELPVDGRGNPQPLSIVPTESFLVADIPTPAGVKVRGVSRTGEIIYDKQGTATGNQGGRIPTVGGGNDLFITDIVGGVNIAVAEPQQVRVMSATGAIIYSGMVQTAVDVLLPTTGVYVITGENEVHKILH